MITGPLTKAAAEELSTLERLPLYPLLVIIRGVQLVTLRLSIIKDKEPELVKQDAQAREAVEAAEQIQARFFALMYDPQKGPQYKEDLATAILDPSNSNASDWAKLALKQLCEYSVSLVEHVGVDKASMYDCNQYLALVLKAFNLELTKEEYLGHE